MKFTTQQPAPMTSAWIAAVAVVAGTFVAACTNLLHDSEKECDQKGACRDTYLSKSVSRSAVTPDEALGLQAIATVSSRGHGVLQLTFYRLREGPEEYRVRDVVLIGSRTMTEGRDVQFDASGVSTTVRGEFSYGTYFPGLPIDVHVDTKARKYTCRLRLEYTRTYSYAESLRAEPTIPRSIAEFRSLPAPTLSPADLVDPEQAQYGCTATARADNGA